MAKYTVTYENGTIKHELQFRGHTYDYTMKPHKFGRKADKPCFAAQLQTKGIDTDDLFGHNDLSIKELTVSGENGVINILEVLTNSEQAVVEIYGSLETVSILQKEDLLKQNVRYIGTDMTHSKLDIYEHRETGIFYATKL